MKKYNNYTVFIVIVAMISFSIISLVFSRVSIKKRKRNFKQESSFAVKYYQIPNSFTLSVSIILIVNTYMYYREIVNIANIAKSIYPIKTYSMLWYVKNVNTGLSVSFITSNLTDLGYIFSYLYLFFFIYNVLSTGHIKRYLLYLLPILIYVIQSVLYGGRTGVLQMATLSITIIYYLLAKIKKINFSKILYKYGMKIVAFTLLTLVAFWFLNDVSGRSGTQMSPLYYVSVYIGSGIKNLDSFVNNSSWQSMKKVFGWETFAGIYSFLKRFTGISYDGLVLEFQPRLQGLFMGNVYTALRRYYYDFGWLGIIVLPSIMSLVMTISEKKCRCVLNNFKTKSKSYTESVCILYGILLYSIIIFFIEDFFYVNIISVNYALKIEELFLINTVLIKLKIVKRIGA